jgi:hypothetical protein
VSRRARAAPSTCDHGTYVAGRPWDGDSTFHTVWRADPAYEEPVELEETILGRVYFALDAEVCQVKIGLTGNVARRLEELGGLRGRPVELLGTLKGGYDLERCLHQRFSPWRREGREWYSTEILPDVLELLTAEAKV